MIETVKSFAASRGFHHFIVAVILVAGVVAGLNPHSAQMQQHSTLLLEMNILRK
jgi:hypothetical protein